LHEGLIAIADYTEAIRLDPKYALAYNCDRGAVSVVEMKIHNAGGLAGLLPLLRKIPLAV
jgi:hypothetical protein